MSGHPHADLMAKAAEIAKTDKEWYRHFEMHCLIVPETKRWMEPHGAFIFNMNTEYRLKPRYIDINGHRVPEPVRERLMVGDRYWLANVAGNNAIRYICDNSDKEREAALIALGLVHLTEEAAKTHVAALLSFTQK